jgi:uncharacterized protein
MARSSWSPDGAQHNDTSRETALSRRARALDDSIVSPDGALSISRGPGSSQLIAIGAFVVVSLAVLFWSKWQPYFVKGFHVAATHQLGKSIISADKATSPKGWQAALSYSSQYALAIWRALVAGMLIAAGIQELLPRDWLLRMLGSRRTRSTAVAGALAIPSMMCTCCAAPAAVILRRSRVSIGATIAYWLGNPVLNPATLVFMGFVLGWRWVALRLVVGVALVFGVATAAERLFGEKDVPEVARRAVETVAVPADPRPVAIRYVRTLARLAIGLLPEYAIIVFALGAVRAFLFPAITPSVAHALWLVVVLAITGTLFVIPTAGEVPIVQSFMAFGLGAGGGGALIMTLPAVSLPSMAMVSRAVPIRVLGFVAASVAVSGLLSAALAVLLRI